jgi:intergrase/recombinase
MNRDDETREAPQLRLNRQQRRALNRGNAKQAKSSVKALNKTASREELIKIGLQLNQKVQNLELAYLVLAKLLEKKGITDLEELRAIENELLDSADKQADKESAVEEQVDEPAKEAA